MSEQTRQNDLFSNSVTILDKYECLSLGATTIGDLIAEKRINCNKAKSNIKRKGKKPDVLIIDNAKRIIAYIECKTPGEFNTDKKIQAAIEQEIDVAKELGVKIFVATDGTKFIWVNALTGQRILDEDGNEIVAEIRPKVEERKIARLLDRLYIDLSSTHNQLQAIKYSDPTNLARKIGGMLKNIKFTTPKDSLYTFVELFLFKYLSDINILGANENFDYIYGMYNQDGRTEAEILYRYIHEPREKISKLFPEAPDRTSIINGFVFHADKDSSGNYISNNADATTFHEILKLFKEYEQSEGKFVDINRDFKSKLFETFTKQEKTKENAGKYFTPLRVVKGMVDMVDIKEGHEICDPACGVGKFLLEAALKIDEPFTFEKGKLVKKVTLYGYEKEMDEKGSTSGYDLTTILAKANTMIYFSSLFKENNNLQDIKAISQELLNETYFSSKTILGTLERTDGKQYDIILANPPYYQSALISKTAKETGFYTEDGRGVEGLFLEWIIKSLKPNGVANVVLPDGIFTNIGNKRLHEFIIATCYIEAIISLPLNTFFNTPKKTYIMTLRKKKDTTEKQEYPVFAYYCASIGESLDVYRFPIDDNDFQTAVNKYNLFRCCRDKNNIDDYLRPIFEGDIKQKFFSIDSFNKHSAWDIDKRWNDEEMVEMGVKKADVIMGLDDFHAYLDGIIADITNYGEAIKCLKS